MADALEAIAQKATEPQTPDPVGDQIERIEKVTKAARANWFWFYGILAYAAITVMSIQDADFFSASNTTELPILNYAVDLTQFMYFAPALITIVFIYLLGLIEQLWGDIAALPARDNDLPITSRLPVWLLIEASLYIRWRNRPSEADSPPVQPSLLGRVGCIATGLLVWVAPPAVVAWYWLRSMVLHDLTMTVLIGACCWGCIFASWLSLNSLNRITKETT